MYSFALITEGITDQSYLQILLEGMYGDTVDVNPLQPGLDSTETSALGKQGGGWENVFYYLCAPDLLENAFYANDHVIIQIDTDCCEHRNFGVSSRQDGRQRTITELREAVRTRLIAAMGEERFEARKDQIHFAIAVESLECWLLPLYGTQNSDLRKIKGCVERLAALTPRKGNTHAKTGRTYLQLSEPMRERKHIDHCRTANESFRMFIDNLPQALN